MVQLNPSMRLKVNRDTFVMSEPGGSVYVRNNARSFRMEGEAADQWLEKLLPVFNGEYTLGELTDGLAEPYIIQVYSIAAMLHENGFVRDVSGDKPHRLPEAIRERYGSQIEFIEQFTDSGGFRFQKYRQTRVLVIGNGEMLAAQTAALLYSGLPRFRVLIGDSKTTERRRLEELAAHARRSDPEVDVELTEPGGGELPSWKEAVQGFEAVVYAARTDDPEELRRVHAACREEGKLFVPAVCLPQIGWAGPLVHPAADACWESAWLRLHRSVTERDPRQHGYSSTAGALLANIAAFELFKHVTEAGPRRSSGSGQCYLLDLETLEGAWHPFLPHPLATGTLGSMLMKDWEQWLEEKSEPQPGVWLACFGRITSKAFGVLDSWDEEELVQLPLAVCRAQAADPLSDGPSELLPSVLCAGLTHEEARREAGLAGVEAYAARWTEVSGAGRFAGKEPDITAIAAERAELIGVGAGETAAEAISRGLYKRLSAELGRRLDASPVAIAPAQPDAVEDARCRFYFQALSLMGGAPQLGIGEELYGFPVVWVRSGDRWYGSTGLNRTLALREALKRAALARQCEENCSAGGTVSRNQPQEPPIGEQAQHPAQEGGRLQGPAPVQVRSDRAVHIKPDEPLRLAVPPAEDGDTAAILHSALHVLNRQGLRLEVIDMAVEPFMREGLAGVVGILLRGEEMR
ncbi:putative thiazole-containing bacteriocin maturation protein [Paenibacillus doosanensis]|uniref:putative thiazole-containing bacteriocin maturation protein n=1 Tax=Paenibacillus doosanensis TaxID=1229154 RepID=UPI0021806A0A|nr:putative thiazole-containing bacteriocin maturation protein [Paenibacillus doosanensis]MCS7462062.1 putative thiazole-containing bacteriocin maturation protein [Paenibacillus doosanensis]